MENNNKFIYIWNEWLKQVILPVKTASKKDSIDAVLRLMLDQDLNMLPVVDELQQYCGIIRTSDVMRWSIVPTYSFITHISNVPDLCGPVDHFFRYTDSVGASELIVKDDSILINADMSTSQVFYLFAKGEHDTFVVVDSDKHVKGIVKKIDFLKIYHRYIDINGSKSNRSEKPYAYIHS